MYVFEIGICLILFLNLFLAVTRHQFTDLLLLVVRKCSCLFHVSLHSPSIHSIKEHYNDVDIQIEIFGSGKISKISKKSMIMK